MFGYAAAMASMATPAKTRLYVSLPPRFSSTFVSSSRLRKLTELSSLLSGHQPGNRVHRSAAHLAGSRAAFFTVQQATFWRLQSQDEVVSPYVARSIASSVAAHSALAQSVPELPPTQWQSERSAGVVQQYFWPLDQQVSFLTNISVLPSGQSSPLLVHIFC